MQDLTKEDSSSHYRKQEVMTHFPKIRERRVMVKRRKIPERKKSSTGSEVSLANATEMER